jgi:phosphatidate phosphatase APP1
MPSDFLKKAVADIEGAVKGAVEGVESAAHHAGERIAHALSRDKEVIVYPTYGYRKEGDEGTWIIRLRVWVSKKRRLPVPSAFLAPFTAEMGELSADDVERLRTRIAHFVADDDSRERVSVRFDEDPSGRTHDLPGETDFNGLLMTEMELPDADARAILAAQKSTNGWIDFTVAVEGFDGKGRARLVEPLGESVISDIDDTIKITEVPAGARVVLHNTFLRDYKPVEEMIGRYREHGDAVMFHYVSGSPWQLHKLLGEFVKGNFPEGAFHMKDLGKNLLAAESWHDFVNFAKGSAATFDQKVKQISLIMRAFPRRKFTLYGDSGEKDPEVFREIKKLFREQVSRIYIRDVVGERIAAKPNRLDQGDGIHIDVIEADTIREGHTQFKD